MTSFQCGSLEEFLLIKYWKKYCAVDLTGNWKQRQNLFCLEREILKNLFFEGLRYDKNEFQID